MKNYLTITLLLVSFAVAGQGTDLKLTIDSWPPFTDTKGNKSILTVLVQEALDRRDIKSTVEIQDFGGILDRIEKGEYDGSPALWASPEREARFAYSEPYLYNQLVLVGRKGSDVNATSFNELKGKRIGVVEHYEYGTFEGKEEVEWVAGKNNQDNLEKLLSDKIDYMLVDALIIQYMLKYQLNDVTTYLSIGLKPLLTRSLHLVLRKDLENADIILKEFNEEIDEMIEDETFNEILELNWVSADVDGDGRIELVLGGDAAGTTAPQNIYGLMMDNSYKTDNGPRRYYIDGKLYEDWDDIPKSYKLDLPRDNTPSEEDVKVKLKF
jgi:polar amino acid transport system substrate-binding protein